MTQMAKNLSDLKLHMGTCRFFCTMFSKPLLFLKAIVAPYFVFLNFSAYAIEVQAY